MQNLHKSAHVMVGLDIHESMPSPIGPPVPNFPHLTCAPLKWVLTSPDTLSRTVLCDNFQTVTNGHDIGALIPHIPTGPNLIFPVHVLLSGSTLNFSVSSVQVGTPGGPSAVAVAPAVVLGFSDNCSNFPIITMFKVLAPGTVSSRMSLSDLMGGILSIVAAHVQAKLVSKYFSHSNSRAEARMRRKILRRALRHPGGASGRLLSDRYLKTRGQITGRNIRVFSRTELEMRIPSEIANRALTSGLAAQGGAPDYTKESAATEATYAALLQGVEAF